MVEEPWDQPQRCILGIEGIPIIDVGETREDNRASCESRCSCDKQVPSAEVHISFDSYKLLVDHGMESTNRVGTWNARKDAFW